MRKRGVRDGPKGFPWVIGRASLSSGAGRWKTQDALFKCGCSGKVLPWIQAPSLWVGRMVDAMAFSGQLFSSNQPPPPLPTFLWGQQLCALHCADAWQPCPPSDAHVHLSFGGFGHRRRLFYVPLEEWELEGGVLIMLWLPTCPCSLPRA